jgi:dienelactone hydrolase
MKLKINILSLFFIFTSISFSFSQTIENGSYNVGFNYYKSYDLSRPYVLHNDTISRPLLIHFWYPSKEKINEQNFYFKNYIDLIAIRENFNRSTQEVDQNTINYVNAYAGFAKQHLGNDTNITTQQILDCSVAAQYGIKMAKSSKKFPLVIYAPSNSKSSVQNHMICEYLASHGYMVISVGSAGKNSLRRDHGKESIPAQVNDMEYILNYFEDSLKINYSNLGLMGFSTGGLANAIFQMNNEKVKAVFSMDGSQEYGHYNPLFSLNEFNLTKTNVPYCLLVNNYENFSVYPYYSSIISEEKYLFRMPYIDHNGFVSYWNFFNSCSPVSKVNHFCDSYNYINSIALSFFDEYLKTKKTSKTKADFNFQTNEYIKLVTTDNTIVAHLGNLILSQGIDSAIQFLNENQEVLSSKETEINILSRQFVDGNIEATIQLLLFNVNMHPNSGVAHFELAKVYKRKGDLSLSKVSLLIAQELDPENTEIIKLLNEIEEPEK